jgi:hypothetical protein
MLATQNGGDAGIFGEVVGGSGSKHVDYERANVAVGPTLDSFKGGKNVFLGVQAGEDAKDAVENVVAGWYAGGGMGRSNVVAGSRAAQFVTSGTAYSVILGALAGFTSKVVTNSVLLGARAAEGVENMSDSMVSGVNTKALNDLVQSVVVGVDATIGGFFGEASERVTALVNGSWIGGRNIVAVGNGLLTQDRSTGIVALGTNINAGAGNNLVVGMDLSLDIGSSGVEMFGRGTRVVGPHTNILALGAGQVEINRSNIEYIGSAIKHDRASGELSLVGDMLKVSEASLDIGGVLRVVRDQSVVVKNISLVDAVVQGSLTIVDGDGQWKVGVEPGAAGTYDMVFTSKKGTRVVFHDHFEAGATNFTGQHHCVLKGAQPRVGMLVVATGEYSDLQGCGVSVDEAIPVVEVSTLAHDPRVFGVVSRVEDRSAESRRLDVGHIGFDLPKVKGEVRVTVNGSGEGGIWVCDEGGPCLNGDLLCSAARRGYAKRQPGHGVVSNYTCAKLTSDCTFGVDGTCFTGCVYKF